MPVKKDILVFILANTEDIWLSLEGIFLVPNFLKTSFNLLLLCVWWEGTHGMCLSRCTDGVRVNFVEFFTLPLCVLGTELRLPGSHRQPLYLRNHLTDLFKYLPETLHTGKVILSQEYSTIRLSRILHTFYFPTCIVCYSSPFRCSFFFSILYHTAAVNVIPICLS